jgi:hypothetical protein
LITTLDDGIFPLDMLVFHNGGFDDRFNDGLFPFGMLGRGVIISMNLVDSRFLPLNVFARTCSQSAGLWEGELLEAEVEVSSFPRGAQFSGELGLVL